MTEIEMFAWVGEDEFGSGKTGIKQSLVPAGIIPLVAMDYDRHKIECLKPALEAQAKRYNKKIRLIRLRSVEVVDETVNGK